MLDFLEIAERPTKKGVIEIYPKFMVKKSNDLMIRGGDFYAIWNDELGMWCTDEDVALDLINKDLYNYANEKTGSVEGYVRVLNIRDSENGMISAWHRFCREHMRDSFHALDEKLVFSNTEINKKDYSSKRLPYPLEPCPIDAYERLISVLYSPEERHKIEWAIGSVVTGNSKTLQKFFVFYGSAGTGKSTIMNIIQALFEGYYSVFDAKALGSSSNAFALEAFKTNPLVAIQHDGDLSKIEDNTRLNSLVSHELMTVNEKFKSSYSSKFNSLLFMGTNNPVKITDAKSGLIRRLIDITPTGNKIPSREYRELMDHIGFELGGIASHCADVYLNDPHYYENYVPINMMGASNDFYNFILDKGYIFEEQDSTTLNTAWEMYRNYCEYAQVKCTKITIFKEELREYFASFKERCTLPDGTRVRNYYSGFLSDKFHESQKMPGEKNRKNKSWLEFKNDIPSILDMECREMKAQYATDGGTPQEQWDNVQTILSDLDTTQLHYLRLPENYIVIDFDMKDEDGNKSLEKNIKAASKWPRTYAELSKSGNGIHLHYIYTGDVNKLSRLYDTNVEIKVFTGKSSLRRKLTMCTDDPISTINSGLPLKEVKMVSEKTISTETKLINTIKKVLRRDSNDIPSTKSGMDLIKTVLDEAYESGMPYDISKLRSSIIEYAASSTNNSDYCLKLVSKLHFKSEVPLEGEKGIGGKLAFYDIEVFPNLLFVAYKVEGPDEKIRHLFNPSPEQIEEMLQYKIVGFNCRRYDNHIIHERRMGASIERCYQVSQDIIKKVGNPFSPSAYDYSETDIYDFASAGNKKSLKKLEIEMRNKADDPNSKMDDYTRSLCKKIRHHELGLDWDKPVPENLWEKVADYCDDDIYATEAAFNYLSADWTARQILADLAGMTVNDTTNTLTTRIIFGTNRNPQSEFCYRNLAEPVMHLDEDHYNFLAEACPEMMSQTHGEAGSLLPYFPGYKYEMGKSTYRGIEVGEGGFVYAEPGMYGNVALLDIASMHPHSVIAEMLFGKHYTTIFRSLVLARVHIKHEEWDIVNNMMGGLFKPYVQRVIDGSMTSTDLANALKTAINSIYGLTSAGFANPFKDPNNKDNIVAKRGALFMIDLLHEVKARGFKVAHIKTDSIKIPDATPDIIQFVMDFGKKYGYTFEHEATYDRMCLVNNAVYIAKYATAETCSALYGYIPGDNKKHPGEWTATGAQFQVPYVFKTLFSKEPVIFADLCETKSVTSSMYLDMNENLPDVSYEEKMLDKAYSDYKKGKLSDIMLEKEKEKYEPIIAKGHNYQFVGRVGQFTPMQPGAGGGRLLREKDGKYYNVSDTTGYRFMESDMVQTLKLEDKIDMRFYSEMVDKAIESLIAHGNYEWFVSDDPYIPPEYDSYGRPIYKDVIPFY